MIKFKRATPKNMEALRKESGEPICAPGVVAVSLETGEEYSASPGDYWEAPDDEALLDSAGRPMVLAHRVCKWVPV